MLDTNRDEGSRSSRWMFKNVSFMAQLRFLGCVYRDVFFFEGGFLVMKRWFDGLKVAVGIYIKQLFVAYSGCFEDNYSNQTTDSYLVLGGRTSLPILW